MYLFRKISFFLMATAICVGLVLTVYQPVAAAESSQQNCTRWHTVKKGEYLSMIAETYDTTWFSIAQINNLSNPSLIFPDQKLCIFQSGTAPSSPTGTPSSSGSVNAVRVKEDQSVTLQAKNLSANTTYKVYLGKYKSYPYSNFLVGSVNTDKSGAFNTTYTIPKQLYDVMKVKVSVTSSRGATTSNWFINATSSGNTGGTGSPVFGLTVTAVKKGEWVKISTKNLPANVSFHVYLNKYGATSKKAVMVGMLRDSKGGSITATFDIPDSIQDKPQLEIIAFNNPIDVSAEAVFSNTTKN
jgi:LysM repeat protein